MKEINANQLNTISGGSAKDWMGVYVSGIQLATGLITGNALRVGTSSFSLGYNFGNAIGLGGVGSNLGSLTYDLIHK